MRFRLKAVDPDGRVEQLEFQALDESGAVQQAQARGYSVLTVRARQGLALPRLGGADRFPVALFSQELLVLVNAGLPLVEAIETLAERERRGEWRVILERVGTVLRQGRPLSTAFDEHPQAFPVLYAATVRASEKTGDLAPALARYVSYQNQLESVRKRLVNASIYPLLLVGVGGLVTLFLLLYVVPRFSRIYEDLGSNLPFFSVWLLRWGQLLEQYGALIVPGLAALIAATAWGLGLPRVRDWLEGRLWRTPGLGERMRVYHLARFYRMVGMLLRGGMPVVPALNMASGLLHPVLRTPLAAASRKISEGRPMSQSLDQEGLTTPVALRMLIVGERSGAMGAMMERIAVFHDEEIARWVDWFTRVFEPILMALIGLVIGLIVILMYLPIFELAGSIQ